MISLDLLTSNVPTWYKKNIIEKDVASTTYGQNRKAVKYLIYPSMSLNTIRRIPREKSSQSIYDYFLSVFPHDFELNSKKYIYMYQNFGNIIKIK